MIEIKIQNDVIFVYDFASHLLALSYSKADRESSEILYQLHKNKHNILCTLLKHMAVSDKDNRFDS